jgi:hypothetical protein
MGMPRYDGSTLVTLETTKGQRVSHPWVSRACGGKTHIDERGQRQMSASVSPWEAWQRCALQVS